LRIDLPPLWKREDDPSSGCRSIPMQSPCHCIDPAPRKRFSLFFKRHPIFTCGRLFFSFFFPHHEALPADVFPGPRVDGFSLWTLTPPPPFASVHSPSLTFFSRTRDFFPLPPLARQSPRKLHRSNFSSPLVCFLWKKNMFFFPLLTTSFLSREEPFPSGHVLKAQTFRWESPPFF